MTTTLSKILADAKGGPIVYQDNNVSMSIKLSVAKEQEIEFEFIKFDKRFRQGFEVSVDKKKGYIVVNEQKLVSPIFWTDTAPNKFMIKCFTLKDQGEINIWNIWQNIKYQDNIDAWIGNSGLYIIDEGNNIFTFHCSNGLGEVCFDELVFKVKML